MPDKTKDPIFILVGCKNDLGEEKKVVSQNDIDKFKTKNQNNILKKQMMVKSEQGKSLK